MISSTPAPELLSDHDYWIGLLEAHTTRLTIERMPLEKMLERISIAEASGPILDPTTYRDKAHLLAEDRAGFQILLDAKRKIAELHNHISEKSK